MFQVKVGILVLFLQFEFLCGDQTEVVFPQCQAKDPQLNSCLKTVFNNFYRYAQEVKKTPNLFSLEYLKGNDLPFEMNLQGLNVRGKFSGNTYRGLEKVKVVAVKNNLEKLRFDLKVFFPVIETNGNYQNSGHLPILSIPINAEGKYQVFSEKVEAILKIHAYRVFKNGVSYFQVLRVLTDMQIKNLKFKITENRSPLLENILNQVLNENAQEYLKLFKPLIVRAIEKHFVNYFNSIFGAVPEHEFLNYSN